MAKKKKKLRTYAQNILLSELVIEHESGKKMSFEKMNDKSRMLSLSA